MDEAIIKAMLVNAIKIGKFLARLKKESHNQEYYKPNYLGSLCRLLCLPFDPYKELCLALNFP